MPCAMEAERDDEQEDWEHGRHMPSQKPEMSCYANGDEGQEGREAKDGEQRKAPSAQPFEECLDSREEDAGEGGSKDEEDGEV